MAPVKGLGILHAAKCLVFLFSLGHCAIYNINYQTPADCLTGESDEYHEYFDISQLTCLKCAQTKDYQTVSANGLKCVCQPGLKLIQDFGGSQIQCQSCAPNEVVSQSGWECVACASTCPVCNPNIGQITDFLVGWSTSKVQCCRQRSPLQVTSESGWGCVACELGVKPTLDQCVECEVTKDEEGVIQDTKIQVERKLDGAWWDPSPTRTCQTCAADTAPNSDGTQCVRCNQVLSVVPSGSQPNGSPCICPTDQEVGGVCFADPDDITPSNSQMFLVTFGGQSYSSAYFTENIQAADAMCKEKYANMTACQVLGNLCVWLMYTRDNEGQTGKEDACAMYLDIAKTAVPTNQEWPPNMPWLYYQDTAVLTSEGITTTFTFPHHPISFKLARYTINGTFLGYEDATNGILQLCDNTENVLNAAYNFGVAYQQQCKMSVQSFWDEVKYGPYFYDLYLEYEDQGESRLFAIPSKILNYVDGNGGSPNMGSDSSSWQLTRRFFLVDNISGKQYSRDNPTDSSTVAENIRYASSITVHIELQSGTTDGKIYPPYVQINYAHASRDDFDADKMVEIEFSVEYSMNLNSYNEGISIATGVISALAVVYSALQTWGWSRRAGRVAIDFVVLVKFVAFGCGNIANTFWVVTLGSSLYWIIFYKNQNNVYLMPPNNNQEGPFIAYLSVAFGLKVLQLIHLLVVQVTIDIFFIDWERPRGKIATSNDTERKGQESAVSIWRTYFVANEWNEIQATRKINPIFQIFAVILFLQVIGFGNLATKDPYATFSRHGDDYYSPDSRMFRYGVAGLTYLLIAVVQWIFFTFIYERWVEDKVRQYCDLCSMSNVSVFILENGQFGYYIHGRSVHGRADTGMREMHEDLKREEEDLCGMRGLIPNSEQQTFQIAVTTKLRQQYDRVIRPIYEPQSGAGQGRVQTAQNTTSHLDAHAEKCVQAYGILNRFLQAYIDHSLREIDYIIKDHTLMENLMSMEFTDPAEKGFFYADSGHAFDAVLFIGHENTLTILEILFFCLIDFASSSYVLAAVLTYVLMQIIAMIRDGLGRANLAKKTLVDKRFLI